MIRAAFGAFDYTPAVGVPFGRMSYHTLLAQGVHSRLQGCLALFADDCGLAGILVLDQIRNRRLETQAIRAVLADVLGAHPSRFMVTATHTHNCPALSPWRANDTGFDGLDAVLRQTRELAAQLLPRLQPVTLGYARCTVPNLVENRRSVYRLADGREQVGTHGSRTGANYVRSEGHDEDELRVLVARDAKGAVAGGLVNLACHPTTMYSQAVFSADYPGVVRAVLAEHFGAPFFFLNGFAGDQSPHTQVGPGLDPAGRCAELGRRIAAAAIAATGALEALDATAGVRVASARVKLAVRLPSAAQVALAWEHLERVLRGERPEPLAPRLYGYAYHFHHQGHPIDDWLAREIIGQWEHFRRSETRVPTEQAEAQVIGVGSLAVAGLPGEPFGCFGRQLREQSPLPQLLCAEHANGFAGYLPPAEAFVRGGYECCLANQSRLEPQAGAKLTAATLKLLARLG